MTTVTASAMVPADRTVRQMPRGCPISVAAILREAVVLNWDTTAVGWQLFPNGMAADILPLMAASLIAP